MFWRPKNRKNKKLYKNSLKFGPDLKGKSVYFFFKNDKYKEGTLIYDKDEKMSYVYDVKTGDKFNTFYSWINAVKKMGTFSGKRSAFVTIFLEPNKSNPNPHPF